MKSMSCVVPWTQQLQCSRLFLLWAGDWCATWHKLVDCQWYDSGWGQRTVETCQGTTMNASWCWRKIWSPEPWERHWLYSVWGTFILKKSGSCGSLFQRRRSATLSQAKNPITPWPNSNNNPIQAKRSPPFFLSCVRIIFVSPLISPIFLESLFPLVLIYCLSSSCWVLDFLRPLVNAGSPLVSALT